ncbi:hypothetical protein [Neobacillus notoginsengisoli]|nr:hypothetical protein [Neobacillus notoginsengisoli]
MEKKQERKQLNKDMKEDKQKGLYGLDHDESLLTVEFATTENSDLKE